MRNFCNGFLYLRIIFACLLLTALLGCDRGEAPKKISLQDVEQLPESTSVSSKPPLRVAISAIISPKETFILYKDILNYITSKTDIPIQLIQKETYEEVNNLIRDEQLEMAFVCSGAYVVGHDKFGMELLVAPQAFGETVYYSYIIVPKDSPVSSFEELRGKKFAFTDPMSNTGKLSPTYLLAGMEETPESFFDSFKFTFSHDKSIQAVAMKMVDGAAVDSLIWENLRASGSRLPGMTKVIRKSEPYGIPPVVVPKGLDPKRKNELRNILLNMHRNAEGQNILKNLLIDQFVEISDSEYDSIRKMEAWIEKNAK